MAAAACKKEVPSESNSKNSFKYSNAFRIINASNTTLNLKFYADLPVILGNPTEEIQLKYKRAEYSNSSFDSLRNVLSANITNFGNFGIPNLSSIIIYSGDGSFNNESVKAISLITRNNEGYYFRHYNCEADSYNLLADSIIKFSTYSSSDLIALYPFEKLANTDNDPTINIIVLDTVNIPCSYSKPLQVSLINLNVAYRPGGDVPGGGCSTCEMGSKGACEDRVDQDGNEIIICTYAGVCRVAIINGDDPVVNVDSIYQFRDSFMSNSAIGRKYIAYYEYISSVINLFERPTSISILDEIDFLVSTVNTAYILQYGENSDIVITTDYYNKAISYINNYQAHITNESFVKALTDIKNDLTYFKLKTKGDLITEL